MPKSLQLVLYGLFSADLQLQAVVFKYLKWILGNNVALLLESLNLITVLQGKVLFTCEKKVFPCPIFQGQRNSKWYRIYLIKHPTSNKPPPRKGATL